MRDSGLTINEAEIKMNMRYNGADWLKGANVVYTESVKDYIDECIRQKTRVVTFYNSIGERRVSTSALKYTTINVNDTCGYISGIDYDKGDVSIMLRWYDCDGGSMLHNGDNEWFIDHCILVPRAYLTKEPDGEVRLERLFGFDIVRIKEDVTNDK